MHMCKHTGIVTWVTLLPSARTS